MVLIDNTIQIRPHLPTSLCSPAKSRPEREMGERQPYCHTNVLDVGLAQNQVLSFVQVSSRET